MKATINHQEPTTKDKPGSAAEPQLFLSLALTCFTSIASPYHDRHWTDPTAAAPRHPGFGSRVCRAHRRFLAACHQATCSQADRSRRRCSDTGARKQQLGAGAAAGPQAAAPRAAAARSGDASPVAQQRRRVTCAQDSSYSRPPAGKPCSDPKRREATAGEAGAPRGAAGPAPPPRAAGREDRRTGGPGLPRDATGERSRRAPAAAPPRGPQGQPRPG